jgi:DNA polymerase
MMASSIYDKPIEDINKEERFVGKTTILGCIAAGTRVLCETGWKPIETVTTADRLWDGENWVCHQGLLEKGLKETVNLCGSWLTPDHKILCGTQWKETQSVVQDGSTLSQALVTGAAKLPLEALSGECGEALRLLSLNAIADDPSIQSTDTTLKTLGLLAAQSVLSKQQAKNAIGSMLKPCQMIPIGQDYSTDFLLLSHGAITQETLAIKTTGVGAYGFTTSGEKTEPSFSLMYRHLKGGITRAWKWIASTTTKGTSQTTYGSQPEARTRVTDETSGASKKKLMTYDLAYAGPNNRFTIWTDSGPVIAHNCGYGMGALKFKAQLKNFGVELEQEECDRIIKVYRETYPEIPRLWREAGRALNTIMKDQTGSFGRPDILEVEGNNGIRLPNGLYIKYPELRKETDEEGKSELLYKTRKGRALMDTRIYGGKVIENVCQALARIVIGEQLLRVAQKYKVVMTVHDAIGCIVPEDEVEEGMRLVEKVMKIRPKWAPDLPLDCEGGYGDSYGAC